MTIKSYEFNEEAYILNSNLQAILKTPDDISEFYLCLNENITDTEIHRKLYQIRKIHQSNSIVKVFTNQDFMTNPINTLMLMFNEAITKYHIEQMYVYNVHFDDMYTVWAEDKTIRFGRALGMLASA
ncbi:hypothetical protein [Paenibacillus xylanexedens]|uniref:hypothetical protein n=1 Tax=Paenibacillus xylanexedens TaxID=528191 RepID=UPI000F5380C6|nr:hypothetical protein [Paenibacillus xylanexedens]